MNLSLPFIKRPVMTSLVIGAIFFFGIIAYTKLPTSALPSIQYPTIVVSASYPGASPETMAERVASPLEQQFMMIQGIKLLASQNSYQSTTLVLQFYLDIDINIAAQEVQEAINKAQGLLPKDLPQNPTYTKSNPSDTPILFLVIHSDRLPGGQLYDYANTLLAKQIGTIEGVAEIDTYGFPYAVRVNLDPQAIAAKDISLSELSDAIKSENPDLPTGKFFGPYRSVTTITDGQINKAEKYNNIIIKYKDGAPVRLRDVAYAEDSIQDDKKQFRWVTKEGAEEVVVLAVQKMLGYNTIEVADNILKLVDKIKMEMPASIEVDIPYNQAKWIHEAIEDVTLTLLVAFILVVLVITLYLGKVRNSLIPILSLPVTLTGTFLLMYILGYSEDILSMSALTLSIGFLVDDAIIVLENIVRRVQYGEKPHQASVDGSKQISITILSISLCLAAAFTPMFFLQGILGRIFHEFSMVIIVAILLSGFISLTFTPMLCSRFIPPYDKEKVTKFEHFVEKINEIMIRGYKPLLSWSLKHKVITSCIGLSFFALSIVMFFFISKSFLPGSDLGMIQGYAKAEDSTSPERMKEYTEQLSKIAIENPYVESIARIVSIPTDNQAILFMNLKEGKRPNIWKVMRDLEQKMSDVIGVEFFMRAFPLINLQIGSSDAGRAQYQYTLQSFDQEKLYSIAPKFIEKLQGLPELRQVSSDLMTNSPYLFLHLLRDQGHAYKNINSLDIETALMLAYGETYISPINTQENTYYVILQVDPKYGAYPQQMSRVYVGNSENQPVAIDSLINKKEVAGPLSINHINGIPSVTLSFDLAEGVPLSTGIAALQEVAEDVLPPSIVGNVAGNTAAFQETFKQLWVLLILAVLVIYLILGILYENFTLPFAALSPIPLAAFGALATLLIFQISLSVYAFIGIIMLLGIVMKNGILIVDFALDFMKEKNESAELAAFEACIVRFRPIFMTTLAAMMGAVPIALGIGGTVAEGRAPLGIVIVGGLIFSQAITLFVTPVAFIFTDKFNHFIMKYIKRNQNPPDHEKEVLS